MADDGLIEFVVSEAEEGSRLDKLILSHLPHLGRRGAARLFEAGAVHVNGRTAPKGARARAGQRVRVPQQGCPIANPELPLDVRLENHDVAVVSKPAGMATAPLDPAERHTLVNALLSRYPETAGIGYRPREPGLLHRLDTQTSGLVVVARHRDAFEQLRAALTSGSLTKKYLAIVSAEGIQPHLCIDLPLEPDPSDPRRVRIGGSRVRHTEATLVQTNGQWALLELQVARAYRHQIRAHLAATGHPIAGDALYGGPEAPALGLRHALHASHVGWAGSSTIVAFDIDDPLPSELCGLMAAGR